jgi:preprotein translocase subunit SecA
MVTGAITQAQVKVEGRNFDMRKRALEFDDVLNNQRNVIYGERHKILAKGDVRETVLDYLHDAAADLVDASVTSSDPDDWDLVTLAAALGPLLGRSDEITPETFAGIESREDLSVKVGDLVDETYEARETALGEVTSRAIERWLLLRTIDTHWVEHLTAMEELREGIYLRGYGQQDPLIAYKNEARTFFDEMTNKIANDVAQTILRISVRTAEQAEQEEKAAAAEPQRTVTTANAASSATTQTNRAATATATPPGQKLGRNDPCWCGSGKKYKKCHGR